MPVQSKQSGFTLIEFVIVIAIIFILASFAIPGYQQMTQNAMIRTATDSILNGIQMARAEAVKRNTNVQFDFRGTNISDWTICVSPAVAGNCPATDDATTIQSRRSGDGSSTNVTINASNAGPYVFNGYGVMVSPSTTNALTINIGNSALSGSRDLRIIVGAGGSTKSCDPALDPSGSDPRKC
jgi:type IV fimbrial biogenesis protein FimT